MRTLIESLPRRPERLHEHRPDLRRQPPAHDDHTVCVLIHVQRSAPVAVRRLPGLGLPVHAPPAAHDPLDVIRGAGLADGEQPRLGFRSGNAGQRADLRIRELAAGERLSQPRQRAERARHADALAGRARIETHAPRQQRGAGAEAGVPAAAASNSRMRSSRCAVAASRWAESSAISSPSRSRSAAGSSLAEMLSSDITNPPYAGATLHPSFGGAARGVRSAIVTRSRFFRAERPMRSDAPLRNAGRGFARRWRHAASARNEGGQAQSLSQRAGVRRRYSKRPPPRCSAAQRSNV